MFAQHNAAISCLGTTKDVAGTAEAYRRIEVDYPNKFADLAKAAGVRHAVLLSSQGANATSWFTYMKQKGEVEDHWTSLAFDTLNIFQPGLLGRGDQMRPAEKVFAWVSKPIPVETVAKAIVTRLHNAVATGEVQADHKPLRLQNDGIYKQATMPLTSVVSLSQ